MTRYAPNARAWRTLPARPAGAHASDGAAMTRRHPLLSLRVREGGAARGQDRRADRTFGSQCGIRRGARSLRDGGARRRSPARARRSWTVEDRGVLSARGAMALCRGRCAAAGARRAYLEHAGRAGRRGPATACLSEAHAATPASRRSRRRERAQPADPVWCCTEALGRRAEPSDRATLTRLLLERGLEVSCRQDAPVTAGHDPSGGATVVVVGTSAADVPAEPVRCSCRRRRRRRCRRRWLQPSNADRASPRGPAAPPGSRGSR